MSIFAKINDENIVTDLVVVAEENAHRGAEFLALDLGLGGKWVESNEVIRRKPASIGDTYLEEYDVFIAEKPFESWTLDYETFTWIPPIPRPDDTEIYFWNEETQNWIQASR